MGFEYVSVRLKALRSRFVPDAEMESFAAGREATSIILGLEDSVFSGQMQRLKEKGEKAISHASLVRAVEEGRMDVIKKTAELVRRWIPECFDLLFSRRELEQLKEAMRCIRLKEPPYERRLRFLELSETGGWADSWPGYRSAAGFKNALEKLGHPMAEGIDETREGAEAEISLERFYFGKYLEKRTPLAGDAGNYFSDLNDMANLNSAALLRGQPSGKNAEKYYIGGTGRLLKKEFLMLTTMSDTELSGYAGKILGRELKCKPGLTGFAQALRQAYLRRWRINAILHPLGPLEILTFMEELDAMAMNLKLALSLSQAPAPEPEMAGYFLKRGIA